MIEVERVVALRRRGASWRVIARQLGVSHVAVQKAARAAGYHRGDTEDVGADGNRVLGQQRPAGGDPALSAEPPRSRMPAIPGARPWCHGVSHKQAYSCDSCGRTIAVGEIHAVRIDGGRPRPRLCAHCHDQHPLGLVVGWLPLGAPA